MTYQELKAAFVEHEKGSPSIHLTAYITFASFGPDNHNTYTWEERTYVVSSNNKAFQSPKCGYSIFGHCLNEIDIGVRLDWYMRDEYGGKDGWTVEDCYIVSNTSASSAKGG